MSDADFWFEQFRNMVEEVKRLRQQLSENRPKKISYNKIKMIKEIRLLLQRCEVIDSPDDKINKMPSLHYVKSFVEDLIDKYVTLESD